jgi:hypothetical protein
VDLLLESLECLVYVAGGEDILGGLGGKSAAEWPDHKRSHKEASQARDYCVAKNATLRAARPDPSPRKERSLRMTIEPHCYGTTFTRAPSVKGLESTADRATTA